MTTLSESERLDVLVTVGIDTHRDSHTAVVLGPQGAVLDVFEFANTTGGFVELLECAEVYGVINQFAVEGAGSYGKQLAGWLADRAFVVVEPGRPKRARGKGKSDPIDAENAARCALAGTATAIPKAGDGPVESIRMLRIVRNSAVAERAKAANRLHGLRVTAPQALHDRLDGLSVPKLVDVCAKLRPSADMTDPVNAAKHALRALARRYQQQTAEITDLDRILDPLVAATAPTLIAQFGVGTDVAGGLLVAAGDNPDRLRDEAAFAALCGVNPIPASSGKTQRHRLNRGGNRDANRCLHIVAVTRLRYHPRTKTYAHDHTAEGKTKREIIRLLKRYIARDLYRHLLTDLTRARGLQHAA